MAAPAMNLFGAFQDRLGSPSDELLGQASEGQQGLLFAGADFGLHSLSQEQKDLLVRQYSQQMEQEREVQARMQQAFEAAAAGTTSGTPTQTGSLTQSHSLSPPSQSSQPPAASQSGFPHSSVSVPHTPLKAFDSGLAGLSASALSTPTISTGSLSLAGTTLPSSAVDGTPAALHSSSPMTPRKFLPLGDYHCMMPPASLLSVHAPAPGQQAAPGQVPPPPPPPPPHPSTPSNILSLANSAATPAKGGASPATAAGAAGGASSAAGQGQLTLAFANVLTQAAVERGVDPAALVQLLQNPKLLDVLLSKAGDLQQQQQQSGPQMAPQMSLQAPPPPPPPKPPQLQSRMSAPVPGEWPHPGAAALNNISAAAGAPGMPPFRPPPPPPPRPSPAAANAAAVAAAASVAGSPFGAPAGGSAAAASGSGTGSSGGSSAASGGSSSGGSSSGAASGGSGSSGDVSAVPMLSGQLVQEFVSARGVLAQLMMSAFDFLNSHSMREFYDKLQPVSDLYDGMHELAVVQKRKRCLEMSYHRSRLVQDAGFMQILQAVCALRHHLHSLSRKVLVMNQQGPDGIPIDLLLGSMSTELFHVMKQVLPQEVCDFFGNCLPHPRLAVLVFAEFTSVDPMPTLT